VCVKVGLTNCLQIVYRIIRVIIIIIIIIVVAADNGETVRFLPPARRSPIISWPPPHAHVHIIKIYLRIIIVVLLRKKKATAA